MLYLNGTLSSGYGRYDVALCLVLMTDPVAGGINETQSDGEADSPRALQCECRSTSKRRPVAAAYHSNNTSEVRYSVKEVTDIGQENMLDKGCTHG